MFLGKNRALVAGAIVLAGMTFFTPGTNADYAMTQKDCQLAETAAWKAIGLASTTHHDDPDWQARLADTLDAYADNRNNPARNRAVLGQITTYLRDYRWVVDWGEEGERYTFACPLRFPLFENVRIEGSRLAWNPVAGATSYYVQASYVGGNQYYPAGLEPETVTGTYVEYAGQGINSGRYSFEVYALTGDPGGRQKPETITYSARASVSGYLSTDLDDGSIDWVRYENGRLTWDKSDLPDDNYLVSVRKGSGEILMLESVISETGLAIGFMSQFGGEYDVTVAADKGKSASVHISLPERNPLFETDGRSVHLLAKGADQIISTTSDGTEYTNFLDSLETSETDVSIDMTDVMEKSGLHGRQVITFEARLKGVTLGKTELIFQFPPAPPAE